MYSLCSWFVKSFKFCHFGPLFHQFQPSRLRHFRGKLNLLLLLFRLTFSNFFNIDVNNIVKSLSKLSFVFNMAIEVFLEEVNLRMVGKLAQNDAWTLGLKFHLDHIFFDKSLLQLHEIVYSQVFKGLLFLMAILLMFYLQVIIGKVVPIVDRKWLSLNIKAFRPPFQLTDKVNMPSF